MLPDRLIPARRSRRLPGCKHPYGCLQVSARSPQSSMGGACSRGHLRTFASQSQATFQEKKGSGDVVDTATPTSYLDGRLKCSSIFKHLARWIRTILDDGRLSRPVNVKERFWFTTKHPEITSETTHLFFSANYLFITPCCIITSYSVH